MFTHLHVHTEYSLLDGISHIPKLVGQAAHLGMDSLAITDHGSLYGVVDFYSAAKTVGINPIIGCEIYESHTSRHTKDSSEKSPSHLTVLSQNNVGYKNLIKLVSKAHLEGFYYRPRTDDDLLQEYNEGLIVLSGCPSAKIPRLIAEGRAKEAASRAIWYKELFQNRFFLEIQQHAHVPDLPAINKELVLMSKTLDIPLVATNDSHYTNQSDAPLQDIRICIHTNTTVHDETRLKMEDDSFYLKSPLEMSELFTELPEAISNTQRIAEMCHTTLDFGQLHLPSYPVPNGGDADEFLTTLCWEGLKRVYSNPTTQHETRLKYELEVIKQTRFANYFLVVWEIVSFARNNSILLGVRGSAAASLALYCLGVTDIDPIEHKLIFERFLNVERKEMPDIDMDFQDNRREEILNYVTERYGKDRVAQIITFGTLGPKAAIRDVGKALGMSYSETDRVARLLPFKPQSLNESVNSIPEIKQLYNEDESIHELIDTAKGLEGIPHHVSTHAAGVVISEQSLTEYVPLQRPARGDKASQIAMTQYAMDPIAKLGLLKMDFLGLTNLTILDNTLKTLEQTKGIKLDLHQIPLDDSKTFQLLSSGQTNEVFQLESAGMQRNIKELKPSSLSDVAAMIALYRPGPMEQIPTFIQAKHGRSPVQSPHPSLDEILKDSYGVIVFQDQVLLLLQTFAGYSLGEADIVRKAMGKKIPELMQKERERFLTGAQDKGFSKTQAIEIFNLIEPFAGYAFNKAHSVSYAQISYWTAYFKANYGIEYMTSVLNSRQDQPEKMSNAISECLRMGISILGPDVNHSNVRFTIDNNIDNGPGIRFGLSAIKNLGRGAVSPIIEARDKNGPYTSLTDFAHRADLRSVNRRALESMIKAGAFDCLGSRGAVLKAMDLILSQSQLESRMRETGQTSLFQSMDNGKDVPTIEIHPEADDITAREKAAWEKEFLGVALSSHPLRELIHTVSSHTVTSLTQIDVEMEGQQISILGQLSATGKRFTKDNRQYLTGSLDLIGGALEIIVWPQSIQKTIDVWKDGFILLVTGKVVVRGENISIYCNDAKEYTGPQDKKDETYNGDSNISGLYPNNGKQKPIKKTQSTIIVNMMDSEDHQEDVHLLRNAVEILLEYPGPNKVNLNIQTMNKHVRMDIPITAEYCEELGEKLHQLLGPGTVLHIEDDTN